MAILGVVLVGLSLPSSTAEFHNVSGEFIFTNRLFTALIIVIGAWLAIQYRMLAVTLQRNEAALDQSRALARLGHFLVPLQRDGIVACSQECLDIAGLAGIEGLSTRTLFKRIVHPDDRRRLFRAMRQALRGERYQADFRIVRPDGDVRDVRSAGQLDGGTGGRPDAIAGTLLDVSDRMRAENALREHQARIASILDGVSDAIIVIDEQGKIESFSASAQALFDYSAQEAIGQPVTILLAGTQDAGRLIGGLLTNGPMRPITKPRMLAARQKNGSRLIVQVTVRAIPLPGRRLFTLAIRDRTSRRRLEDELRQAHKMEAVGQLTGGIAHDFNNLLTVIMGNLEMIETRNQKEPERTLLREAREATELGAELTSRLLTFSRRQPLDMRALDLNRMIDGLISLLRRTLGERVEVHFEPCPGLSPVLLDPIQFETSLFNLAINARDAMPEGGRLTIALRRSDAEQDGPITQGRDAAAYVVVTVSDTGTGMSEAVRRRALEPFFTTKERTRGTGLGLSMVYGFVKQLNGHLTIDGIEGRGTTIRLYLPRAPENWKPQGGLQESSPEAHRGDGQKVLVVEDDPRVRRLTVSRLESLGYTTVEAGDGHEALARLAEHHDVALLFSDYVMPGGMSGDDLARQVRIRHPGIRIMLSTGYARPEQVQRSRRAGITWLSKPYMTADLARAAAATLAQEPPAGKRRRRSATSGGGRVRRRDA